MQDKPSGHTTLKWRRVNVDATWSRRIDVDTTSFWYCVPAGSLPGDGRGPSDKMYLIPVSENTLLNERFFSQGIYQSNLKVELLLTQR